MQLYINSILKRWNNFINNCQFRIIQIFRWLADNLNIIPFTTKHTQMYNKHIDYQVSKPTNKFEFPFGFETVRNSLQAETEPPP